jgi:uncharacterized repeat protein (TIGR01451 family)
MGSMTLGRHVITSGGTGHLAASPQRFTAIANKRSRLRNWVQNHPMVRVIVGMVAVIAVALGTVLGTSVAVSAVPGTPQQTQPSTVVFEENFENGPGTAPQGLTAYTGLGGQKYTAATPWLTACNGSIVNFTIPPTTLGNCATVNNAAQLRQLAYALGVHSRSAAPASNDAVAAYTENNPGANATEFQTVGNIPLAGSNGRFLTFSVDTAAVNCGVSAPQYQFAFLNQSGTATNVGGLLNACTSTATVTAPASGPIASKSVNVGTYTSNGSVLFNGSSLGIRMQNANGSGVGNDAAFDNIRVLDATPQLDKSFSPATVTPGQVSKLTFTVTNTSELAAKNGWSFTDNLPAGLTLATPSAATTNCPSASVTAVAGATSLSATGNLAAGSAFCTISVNVVTPNIGSYANGPDNVVPVGLNEPAVTTLTVTPIQVTCTTDANVFNTGYNAATGGILPNNAKDANWLVAGRFAPSTAVGLPPANAAFAAANVGNMAAGAWLPSPYGNAQWISQQTIAAPSQGGVSGDWYYRFQFDLDQEVDPAQFALAMNFYADNNVAEVYVNNVAQSTKTTGLPQFPLGPWSDSPPGGQSYYGSGFTAGNEADTTLSNDWQTGLNTILVQIKSGPNAEGFNAQVRPSVLCPTPGITVEKQAGTPVDLNDNGITDTGDTIQYSFVVTNTGETTLTDVSIDDPKAGAATCPTTILAVDASVTCTADDVYVITDADAIAGSVDNTATASGTSPSGTEVTSEPSTTETPATIADPAITVAKSAQPAGFTDYVAGQSITYTFVVTNTGNVPLVDVTIDEGSFTGSGEMAPIVCPAGAALLAPGAQVTCTTTYIVTQADFDAGSLTNSATATGTPPQGDSPVSPPSEVTIPSGNTDPALTLVKSSDLATVTTAGQTVNYSFLVTNTGNVTLAAVAIADTEFSGTGGPLSIACPTGAQSLAPGAQVTCSASYLVTQADIDAGTITNAATASGTPPEGDPIDTPPSEVDIDVVESPAITVDKTADPATAGAVGDTIAYSFLVTNTGNVTLADVAVTEGAFTGSGDLSDIVCPTEAGSLAPGGTITCTAGYVLTQADVDNGRVSNTATATGTPNNGTPPISPPDTSIVEIPEAAGITVVKTADEAALAAIAVGQTVDYSFLVTNTGNVTLDGIVINDVEFSGTGELSVVDCPVTTLLPGEQVTCIATYVVTQADVDSGQVTNTATAEGSTPGGATETSEPSTEAVPAVVPAPSLVIAKSATPGSAVAAGETITYTFVVTNNGNVTITDAAVDEGDFSGSGELSAITCAEGTASLAPGASVTCTATYVTTQADIDSGAITNAATATGTSPTGTPVQSPPGEATVETPATSTLTVVKTADAAAQAGFVVGQEITYSFLVTNTGNVTLDEISVDDTDFSGSGELSDVVCPAEPASLAPGASVTCDATYTATQADVDAAVVNNTAIASGTPPTGDPVSSDPSDESTPSVPADPALTIAKTADPATGAVVGDEVTYSFLVTNTGNVTLTDIEVTEGDFSGSGELSEIDCPSGIASLAPGEDVTCTATYAVTQADVDSGEITNVATATGTPPNGPPIESPPGETTIELPGDPELTIVKTADEAALDGYVVGQTVTYSFLITNTGTVSISDVAVSEGPFSGTGVAPIATCPEAAALLAPGASVTCTATYVLTQADVDAGTITNSARATGDSPDGTPVTSTPSTEEIESVPADPVLTVVKTSNPTSVTTVGQTITYSFLVTNTGNVTLTDVGVDDTDFSGSGDLSNITCPAGTAELAPGASVTCTASYVATQADIDAGEITNTATATGTPPTGDPIDSPPGENTVDVPATPSLSIVKSVDTAAQTAFVAGQEITYSFAITNTGNVTMTDIEVNDIEFSGSGTLSDIVCPAGASSLAPGASVTCTATYTATQADVDAGVITNVASATGTPPTGDPLESDPSEATTPSAPATPSLSIVKSANPNSIIAAGQTITYSFLVTNTGNVTMTDIMVNEGDFSGTGELSAITCPGGAASLAPGATVTCTATYVTTQADVDAGSITNAAMASGTTPTGGPIESPPDENIVQVPAAPAISIVKSVDEAAATQFVAGQTITYSFLVTNTGNVTMTDVTVDDVDFSGSGVLSAITCPEGAASLAPGASVTCTATYVATQADVDAGEITNTATATATSPAGEPVTSDPSDAETPAGPAAPSLTVVKTSDPASITIVGATIAYSFVVTNTGNVTLTDVGVNEGDFSGTGDLGDITCGEGLASLAPGVSVTCTASYVATQADVDSGSITNTATASGTPPTGPPIDSPPSENTVEVPATPALTVMKSSDEAAQAGFIVGQAITYSFLVTNTGNVTLDDIVVNEGEFSGSGELSDIVCPAAAGSLAPGTSVTCTATYVATQADVDAGVITNTATATGTPPSGDPVESDPSEETTPSTPATPSLSIAKTSNPATIAKVGDSITYSFLTTNTGNVTITDVTIAEGEFSGTGELSAITCPEGAASLAPGASVTCTATYVVTQADIDSGALTNTATAIGTPPSGPPIESPPGDNTVDIPATPAMTILKSATPDTASNVGETITYSFVVTNTGNVTIANVSINDTGFSGTGELSAITCPEGAVSLAPGASITCTATYVLTQADVDAEELTNVANSTGTTPGGDPVDSPTDEVVVELTPAPALTVVKTADEAAQQNLVVGQTVTYSFLVTNTGNVTMTDIGISDVDFSGSGELSTITCPEGAASLAPGATVTCTATYVVTQADIDAGTLTNTATAIGTPLSGDPLSSPESEVSVPGVATPALDVVKSADVQRATTAGQVITYSFVATNTGNVTLTNVKIVEGQFTGTGTLSAITCPAGAASLAPGAQVTCTATYVVTTADLTSGSLTNTATGTASTPDGGSLTSPPSSSTVETPKILLLPNTGMQTTFALGGGATVFAIGALLLYAARRRRSATHEHIA